MVKPSDKTRRIFFMILAILPGAGQLAAGRLARGVVGMMVVSVCTCLVLADRFIFQPFLTPKLRISFAAVAAVAYILSFVDTAYLAKVRFNRARRRRRNETFNRGNLAVMCGRFDEAGQCYGEAVAADPEDVNALLKLALVEHLAGDNRMARIHLQECRHMDDQKRWTYEIESAMNRLGKSKRTGSPTTADGTPAGPKSG